MSTILAIDTSNGFISLCVSREGEELYRFKSDQKAMQAELLVPEIENALAACKLTYQDLTHLITLAGPGSFTGIRISLAALKGITLVWHIPIAAMSLCDLAIWFATHDTDRAEHNISFSHYMVLADARRNEFYMQSFDASAKAQSDIELCNRTSCIEKLKYVQQEKGAVISCHPINQQELGWTDESHWFDISESLLHSAPLLAKYADHLLKQDLLILQDTPLYVRPPDAALPGEKVSS